MLRQIYLLLQSAMNGNALNANFGGFRSTEFIIAEDLAVGASPVNLNQIDVSALEWLGVQINNAGVNPLTAFEIQVKSNSTASWISLFNTSGDYTAPPLGSPLKGASGDLTILPGGAIGWLMLDVGFYTRVRFVLTSADGTTIAVRAGGKALTLLPVSGAE